MRRGVEKWLFHLYTHIIHITIPVPENKQYTIRWQAGRYCQHFDSPEEDDYCFMIVDETEVPVNVVQKENFAGLNLDRHRLPGQD